MGTTICGWKVFTTSISSHLWRRGNIGVSSEIEVVRIACRYNQFIVHFMMCFIHTNLLPSREYRSRFTNEETVSFCLRVMVGVIILYDHVHPVGAFAKTSKIDVSCILFDMIANYFHAWK